VQLAVKFFSEENLPLFPRQIFSSTKITDDEESISRRKSGIDRIYYELILQPLARHIVLNTGVKSFDRKISLFSSKPYPALTFVATPASDTYPIYYHNNGTQEDPSPQRPQPQLAWGARATHLRLRHPKGR